MEDVKQKKILAIIPARGGSKGLSRKNIADLNGKPLIAWTIEAAKSCRYMDRVVVSTEDEEIDSVSRESKAHVIKRPLDLSDDTTPTIDVVLHVLERLEEESYTPDYVMLLQCTSPLRTSSDIDRAIELFFNNEDSVDSLISVVKEEHPPWWLKTIGSDGLMKDFMESDKLKKTRRQDFPSVYRLNGAIYLAKTQALRAFRGFETGKTIPFIMSHRSSIDIDNELDLLIAQSILGGYEK